MYMVDGSLAKFHSLQTDTHTERDVRLAHGSARHCIAQKLTPLVCIPCAQSSSLQTAVETSSLKRMTPSG